jgi:hypothetical protein
LRLDRAASAGLHEGDSEWIGLPATLPHSRCARRMTGEREIGDEFRTGAGRGGRGVAGLGGTLADNRARGRGRAGDGAGPVDNTGLPAGGVEREGGGQSGDALCLCRSLRCLRAVESEDACPPIVSLRLLCNCFTPRASGPFSGLVSTKRPAGVGRGRSGQRVPRRRSSAASGAAGGCSICGSPSRERAQCGEWGGRPGDLTQAIWIV